jgi:hypothetical protein
MQTEIQLQKIQDFRTMHGIVEYDRVIAYPGEQPCTLTFKNDQFPEITFQGFDIFDNFCKLRKFLEQEGWQVLCNGARINAFPYGQARSMGGGYKLYLLEPGNWPTRNDLVKIFEDTNPQNVGTVDEQHDFYRKWLKSVNPKSP